MNYFVVGVGMVHMYVDWSSLSGMSCCSLSSFVFETGSLTEPEAHQ